jgi:hypothetical protein
MRRPTWTETLLLVGLAAALAALAFRGDNPLAGAAYAGGGGGTNSIIAFASQNTGQNRAELLYLIDTSKQRICIYHWNGDRLGLVTARAYDFDLEVADSSIDKANIENGTGATRGYVKAQVEAWRKAKELPAPQ